MPTLPADAIERIRSAICRETCAAAGDLPCPPDAQGDCDSPGCAALATAILAALEADHVE